MSIKIAGVRSFVTYCQNEEPTDPRPGEIWYRPLDRYFYLRTEDGVWKRHPDIYGAWPFGYVVGGANSLSSIERFNYPFSAGFAVHVGNIDPAPNGCWAGVSSSEFGYFTNQSSEIFRFEFPFDDGVVNNSAGRQTTLVQSAGCAGFNSSTEGYLAGGKGSYTVSYIEMFAFPFDSGNTTPVAEMAFGVAYHAGLSSSTDGYLVGGAGADFMSTIQRTDFPVSANAVSAGYLSVGRQSLTATSSPVAGYAFGGANGSGELSTLDKFLFPVNGGTAVAVGNLRSPRMAVAACSSTSQAFVSGGGYGTGVTYIERLDFSSDVGTATLAGYLNRERYFHTSLSGVDPHARW